MSWAIDVRRVLDPAWVDYSSQFYKRRWLIPAFAASIDPFVGHDTGVALRVASVVGYVLLAPLLFLLLRRRFSPVVSVGVTALCLLAPPVYRSATGMPVGSWGLALEVLAILSVVIVKDRGRRWIWLWTLSLLALSITRDSGMIVLLGVLCLTLVERRDVERLRTNLLLLGTGVAAALPAFLIANNPQVYRLELVFLPVCAIGWRSSPSGCCSGTRLPPPDPPTPHGQLPSAPGAGGAPTGPCDV